MFVNGAKSVAMGILMAAIGSGVWAAEPVKRDQLIKETTEANKAGTIDHHGDAKVSDGKPEAKKSALSREQVKKETAAARKSGALDSGDADKLATKPQKPKSEVSRAAVKQEAASAAKAHITGDMPQPKP